MLNELFKKISIEAQGIFALVLGMILILGTLGIVRCCTDTMRP